eukprot:1123596-Pleurochrysis_carterae.AAC.1
MGMGRLAQQLRVMTAKAMLGRQRQVVRTESQPQAATAASARVEQPAVVQPPARGAELPAEVREALAAAARIAEELKELKELREGHALARLRDADGQGGGQQGGGGGGNGAEEVAADAGGEGKRKRK